MTVSELNARYGAPGRIVFREGFAGYPNVVLASKYGTAEVAFRPAKRDYNRGDGVHCGIPVCWPQFGNRFSKDLPQHGFARKMVFKVRGAEYSEEMTVTAWSFIIGVLPLVFAHSAGAGAMCAIGICTMGGMLAATFVGIIFVPALYALFQRLRERVKE